MLAAMKATRWGARIVTAGVGAGAQVSFSMGDLLFRTLSVVGTGQRPAVDRENMWRHLLKLATEHRITVDHMEFDVKQIAEAWTLQRAGPHAKITAAIKF
jgi:threonine dehydrogenase-like Zn-dependent dehydrogenase